MISKVAIPQNKFVIMVSFGFNLIDCILNIELGLPLTVLVYTQSRQPEEAKDKEILFTSNAKSETIIFLAGLSVYHVIGRHSFLVRHF